MPVVPVVSPRRAQGVRRAGVGCRTVSVGHRAGRGARVGCRTVPVGHRGGRGARVGCRTVPVGHRGGRGARVGCRTVPVGHRGGRGARVGCRTVPVGHRGARLTVWLGWSSISRWRRPVERARAALGHDRGCGGGGGRRAPVRRARAIGVGAPLPGGTHASPVYRVRGGDTSGLRHGRRDAPIPTRAPRCSSTSWALMSATKAAASVRRSSEPWPIGPANAAAAGCGP